MFRNLSSYLGMNLGEGRFFSNDSRPDWVECRVFTPIFLNVSFTEKIVAMNLRHVSDWMKRQIFR